MEQQNKENIQNIVDNVVPAVQQPKQNNILVIILSVLLLTSVSVSGYFAYQTQMLVKELTFSKFTPTPAPTIGTKVKDENLDKTQGWKIYEDLKQGVNFKYPPTWSLTQKEKGDEIGGRVYNSSVLLKKDSSEIEIMFDIIGIGGGPRNVPYDEMNLWGKKYYKQYGNMDNVNNTKRVDLSDFPTGLGVFSLNSKTYSISLTYKVNEEGEKPNPALSEEFDQILSTFKFTN